MGGGNKRSLCEGAKSGAEGGKAAKAAKTADPKPATEPAAAVFPPVLTKADLAWFFGLQRVAGMICLSDGDGFFKLKKPNKKPAGKASTADDSDSDDWFSDDSTDDTRDFGLRCESGCYQAYLINTQVLPDARSVNGALAFAWKHIQSGIRDITTLEMDGFFHALYASKAVMDDIAAGGSVFSPPPEKWANVVNTFCAATEKARRAAMGDSESESSESSGSSEADEDA